MAGNEHTADDVDELEEENDEAVAGLVDGKQDGLNVVLDKDAGHGRVFVNFLALLGDGVLVGLDCAAADAVDGGDDGEVVLELVKVGGGDVDGAVEGVDEGGIKCAVGELGDDVGKVELVVVQMLAKFHVAVSSGGDVEVALNLVEVKGAVDATAVSCAPEARSLAPFGTLLSESDNVMNVLLSKALVVVGEARPALARVDAAVGIVAELVDPIVHPLGPLGRVAVQHGGGEDSVTRGVLDVDVEVGAEHVDDNVEVDLHLVRDSLFDGKVVRLFAAPPAGRLGAHEDKGDEDHCDSPFAAAGGAGYVFGLGFGKGIKGANDAALGSKVVFIKTMLFETVHGWGSAGSAGQKRVGERWEFRGVW